MRVRSRLLMLACLAPLAIDSEAAGEEPPPDEQQVRAVFHTHDYDKRLGKRRQQLISMGEKAFPAYEAILSDPKATAQEVAGVVWILSDLKGDRRRFLKHAIARLADEQAMMRLNAVTLLSSIGSPAEASLMVASLSDEYKPVAYAAAKTLATIGGPNEMVAMDVWLRGVSHRDDRQLREHVQKCRDALKKRLDEARAKDPSK